MTPNTTAASLLRARWASVLGELLALMFMSFDGVASPAALLVVVVHAASVGVLGLPQMRPHTQNIPPAVPLLVDVAMLTALLALGGGASNPFSVVYFVQVVLAAVLLPGPWVALVWTVSVGAYGLLFLLAPGHHHGGFASHLYGMWAAFAAASGALGILVTQLSTQLRRRQEELRLAREREAQAQRLAGLSTLAAGAAHELGTPLGTIALVASELHRELPDNASEMLREDIQLIREQVDRCRRILDSMSVDAGDAVGETAQAFTSQELASQLEAHLSPERQRRLQLEGEARWVVPVQALTQAVENLVQNAFDASPEDASVKLRMNNAAIVVSDRGSGMNEATRTRAIEPFFTTKEPGQGMGLGLFLVNATAEALGGALSFSPRPGGGTIATLDLGPATSDAPSTSEQP